MRGVLFVLSKGIKCCGNGERRTEIPKMENSASASTNGMGGDLGIQKRQNGKSHPVLGADWGFLRAKSSKWGHPQRLRLFGTLDAYGSIRNLGSTKFGYQDAIGGNAQNYRECNPKSPGGKSGRNRHSRNETDPITLGGEGKKGEMALWVKYMEK